MTRPYLIGPPQGVRPIRPRLPHHKPTAFESFDIKPWWERATCAEVDCEHWRLGWDTILPNLDPRADYIRHESGRRFTETVVENGVRFHFPPGQECFAASTHRRQANRPELYILQTGDWRARLGKPRIYDRPDQWADDFHSRTEVITRARSRAGTGE
jgi:hypothetical protein